MDMKRFSFGRLQVQRQVATVRHRETNVFHTLAEWINQRWFIFAHVLRVSSGSSVFPLPFLAFGRLDRHGLEGVLHERFCVRLRHVALDAIVAAHRNMLQLLALAVTVMAVADLG